MLELIPSQSQHLLRSFFYFIFFMVLLEMFIFSNLLNAILLKI